MNAIIKSQLADRRAQGALIRAKTLIEGHDVDSATHIYADLLQTDLTPMLRGEVQTNLAAALCLLAQQHLESAAALDQLEQARDLLLAALQHRRLANAPQDWVATRANLGLVHLARYQATGNESDILFAHLALDGIEPALRQTDDPDLLNWIMAIREHLVDLQDRRKPRRR